MDIDLINKLEYSMRKKEPLIIYHSLENDRHFAGIVEFILDDFVLIKYINDKGCIDGYSVFRLKSEYYISTDCKYYNRIIKLFKYKNKTPKDNLIQDESKIDNILKKMFEIAKTNNKLLSIYYSDKAITCKILDINNKKVYVQEYNYFGEKLDKIEICYQNIDSIFYDTYYEQDIEVLINN